MALPNQLKSARMSDSTLASTIDNEVGNLEQAIADILGIPINTNITAKLFDVVAGGLQKIILQDLAGDPAASGEFARNANLLKYRDSSAVRALLLFALAAGPTANSILFAEAGGRVNEDTVNLIWDNVGKILTAATLKTLAQQAIDIRPFGVGAGQTGEARFKELAANGANFVGFKSPDALAADVMFVLPNADGSAGQFLKTDGAKNFGWGTPQLPIGAYGSVGNDCRNNATNPNNQYDLDCDIAVLRNSSNEIVVRFDPGAAITVDINTAGPVANGRDQAAAFGANATVRFFRIWNGTTLAGIASLATHTTGPALPSGYTHWEYVTTIPTDGSSNLRRIRTKGNIAYYETRQNVLSGGAATVETPISVSSFVPPEALSWFGHHLNNSSPVVNAHLRYVAGQDYFIMFATNDSVWAEYPNVGQQFLYINAASGGALIVHVQGYRLPNGG